MTNNHFSIVDIIGLIISILHAYVHYYDVDGFFMIYLLHYWLYIETSTLPLYAKYKKKWLSAASFVMEINKDIGSLKTL